MKNRLYIPLLLLTFALTLVGLAAHADWGTGWGCFTCLPHDFGTNPDDKCWQVGDGETGEGIQCENPYGFGGHICVLSGGPCLNTVVTPPPPPPSPTLPGGGTGGGGTWGGGGSTQCTIYGWGSCPLNCGTCTVIPLF